MPTIIRTSFHMGMKSSLEPSIIPEFSFWRGYNVRSDLSGILRIREGTHTLFESLGSGTIQGAVEAFDCIIFVFLNKVYKYDFSTDNASLIQNVDVTDDVDDKVSLIRWSSFGQEVVYIFGGDGIFETDGTAVSPITPYTPGAGEDSNLLQNPNGPQNGNIAVLRASLSQRIAVSGYVDSPNTVYLSDPLNVTYFPVTQVIQLPDDGAKITGLTNWYNTLLIFRDRDIWAFFGSDLTDASASLVVQDSSTGCIAPKTITHVPNLGVCFLGPDNVYSLQGVTGVENQSKAMPIGDDIANLLQQSIKDGGVMDASAIYHNRELRICLPRATHDERVFRLFLQNEPSWFIDTGPTSNHFVTHDGNLYGSYTFHGTLHQITKDTVFDETMDQLPSQFGNLYNEMMFNESQSQQIFTNLYGIPIQVMFRREDLQPGPARIKKIFLYVMSIGKRETQTLSQFGNLFNGTMYNVQEISTVLVDTSSEQHFDVTMFVDGNQLQIDDFKLSSTKINNQMFSIKEPIRVYEAILRPSLKGHYVQLKIEAKTPGEIIGILGYGIDYQPKGRIRGVRDGITNNKSLTGSG